MFDDEDDCDGCGRFECECDEDREVDDFDRCPDCNRIDCWGCDGSPGECFVWYPRKANDRRRAILARGRAAARLRAEEQRAILARFGHRLRRAILAARQRRDRCGSECLRRGTGRFSHTDCPIPF